MSSQADSNEKAQHAAARIHDHEHVEDGAPAERAPQGPLLRARKAIATEQHAGKAYGSHARYRSYRAQPAVRRGLPLPLPLPLRAWALRAQRWFAANTFVPPWLDPGLRRPELGYLAALLTAVLSVALGVSLLALIPDFPFVAILPLLGVVFVALNWGAGPSLVATVVSAMLLSFAVLAPRFTLSRGTAEDMAATLLYLMVGGATSLIASQVERARREAAALAESLRHEMTASELERQRLQAVLDVLPVGVIIAAADGRILARNAVARQIWGEGAPESAAITLERDQPEYKGWWAKTGEPIAPAEWALARALRTGETSHGEEIAIESFDGQRKQVLNSAAPIRDADGQIAGGVVALVDISGMKALERESAERTAQLEAIFDAIADGIYVYDREGALLRTNRAAQELNPRTEQDDYLARGFAERIARFEIRDAEGRPLHAGDVPVARVMRGATITARDAMDTAMRTEDGRDVLLNTTGAPVRGRNGEIEGAVIVSRDVTERRRLERRTSEALRALLAMAEALVQVPDMSAAEPPARGTKAAGKEASTTPEHTAHDEARTVVRVLDLLRSMLGCARVGVHIAERGGPVLFPLAVIGLDAEQEREWQASQPHGVNLLAGLPAETVARLLAGEVTFVDYTRPPFQGRANPYGIHTLLMAPMRIGQEMVGLLTLDYASQEHTYTPEEIALAAAGAKLAALVVERERLLREREAARGRALALQEANQRLDEFLSIASHELRTPLTSAKANVQLAARQVGNILSGPALKQEEVSQRLERARSLLERTDRQMDRQERLVGDLLDMSRIQAGKLDVRMAPADLAEIVRDAAREQRLAHPGRALTVSLPPGEPPVPVEADADRIGQVVTNYLTNALKYSPAGAPVEVGLDVADGVARVWVRDEGPGLPPEERERIWERFHRVRGIEAQGSGVGLGLGLYISKTIMELHGGTVGVESTSGQGATFWFTLPLAQNA